MATRSKSRSTPIERIKSLRNQLNAEMENVKVEFARQLAAACQTHKALVDLGANHIFADSRFAKSIRLLGIGSQAKSSQRRLELKPKKMAGKKTGPRKGKMTVATAILKSLSSGSEMDIKSIASKASEAKGKKISAASINQTLFSLKKGGKVESPKRGSYKLKQ